MMNTIMRRLAEFIVLVHSQPVGVGFPLRTAIGIGQGSKAAAEALARCLGYEPSWEHVDQSEIDAYLNSREDTAGALK